VRRSCRIGLTKAAHRRLRFYAAGSPFVSGPARLNPA
jgi:3-methyladenine DNA glycosylase Mpg